MEFKDGEYEINTLSFFHSGNWDKSDWEANPERFEGILKAISNCPGLKASLKVFKMTH